MTIARHDPENANLQDVSKEKEAGYSVGESQLIDKFKGGEASGFQIQDFDMLMGQKESS